MKTTLEALEAKARADKVNEHSASFGTLFLCYDGRDEAEYYSVSVGAVPTVYRPISRDEAAALVAAINENVAPDDDMPFVTDGKPVADGPAIPQPEFIPIADMDAWREFWRLNTTDGADGSELEAIGHDKCLTLAMNCNLVIGGGAAPAFRIGFVD